MSYIQLAEANCRNCLRCVRVCPTKAMTYTNHQPTIMENECILCGKCYLICPHSAKKVSSDMPLVQNWLAESRQVILSVAPSFASVWPNYPALKKKLLTMGFSLVEETAVGAKYISQEYLKLIEEGTMRNIITTCCPAVVSLVRKYFPDLIDQLAPVVSPMSAHARLLKDRYPDCKVVFLSPCIAKEKESKDESGGTAVDAVISMPDLAAWLKDNTSHEEYETWESFEGDVSRLYPTPGGILKTLSSCENPGYHLVDVEGIDRCMEVLQSIRDNQLSGYFFEMSSCNESCLGGPLLAHFKHNEWLAQSVIRNGVSEKSKIIKADSPISLIMEWQSEPVMKQHHSDAEIRTVLDALGKNTRQKELDCGACGYETCRDKAIAVLEGKADPKLCLPYALEHAESVSNLIIEHTPNGIIVLDENQNIREINPSAKKMLKLEEINAVGLPIISVLPDPEVEKVLANLKGVQYCRAVYPQYNKILEHALISIEEQHYIVIILMDLTEEETKEKVIRQMRRQTVDITQSVIDDQMRVVQEIASLLGETTAKSKVALTRLMKAMNEDD